ncbi:MAG TPA: hypothetical protein VGQ00_04585 [Candidatus Norongarragalinales archaeon]|jgi:hypothetical protein|nr:hypothetical protein [Candidatus Norongarragalinales archaeon]
MKSWSKKPEIFSRESKAILKKPHETANLPNPNLQKAHSLGRVLQENDASIGKGETPIPSNPDITRYPFRLATQENTAEIEKTIQAFQTPELRPHLVFAMKSNELKIASLTYEGKTLLKEILKGHAEALRNAEEQERQAGSSLGNELRKRFQAKATNFNQKSEHAFAEITIPTGSDTREARRFLLEHAKKHDLDLRVFDKDRTTIRIHALGRKSQKHLIQAMRTLSGRTQL